VALPVEFARSDVGVALLLIGSAVIASVPAMLAYREPASSALRG
jgi:putative ABC transport system permease protein